jgi:hypothetical protein
MICDGRDVGSNTKHPGHTNINNPVFHLLPLLSQLFTDLNKIHCRPRKYSCDDDNTDDAGQIIDQNNKNENKNNRMIRVPNTYLSEYTNDSNSFWRGYILSHMG